MKCPNCGADVPVGDLFCGECGTRVVPEEKPTPPPSFPSVVPPPAEKPKRGLPRGLLIGCGGLLALAIIAVCIFGAVTLLKGKEPTPTLTPTRVAQKPTKTATPTDTVTPTPSPTATPTEVVPTFELVAFAQDVTDDEPINPGTTFPAGTTKVYAVFEFNGMKDGMTYEAYWYLDGQEELYKSWEWSLGEKGTSWINIFDDDGLTPGNYELEIFVGDLLVLNDKFVIQAGFAGTVSNVRFALGKSDDDLPVGISDVFSYGIIEVSVFFDYEGFGDVTEIESTWLHDGQTEASGTLDWTGKESGTYRVRFYDDEPLVPGDYEWQLRVVKEDMASGSFRIEEPLFFDDFSDPRSGWLEYSDDESTQGYRDEAYFINISVSDLMVWDLAGYVFDDFTLQVDAKQTAGDEGNSYGVVFRYVDEDNFYSFDVIGDGYFSLSKQEGGEWFILVDWQESVYINLIGEPNCLKVTCQGDQITLYINDRLLVSVTDDAFDRGDIGLHASAFTDVPEIEAVFDNLLVTENP